MKNKIINLFLFLICLNCFAQLPVSTEIQNKKVLMEEFTGIYCGYCPKGHKKVNELSDSLPGDIIAINIHTGTFAEPDLYSDPDYRTIFGDNIGDQAFVGVFPSATLNRGLFAGLGVNSLDPSVITINNWEYVSSLILDDTAYVNIAMEGELNFSTRILDIDVEIYFTGNTAPDEVNLNVALLQSRIAGKQYGGSYFNPENILPDGLYEHNHMLRYLITGQWGDIIDTTLQGSTISRHYSYSIPEDYNNIECLLEDMEIVGFVAEGQKNIINSTKGELTYTGLLDDNIRLRSIIRDDTVCGNSFEASVYFRNIGANNISSLKFQYFVTGQTPQYKTWTGNLNSFEDGSILIDDIDISNLASGQLTIEIIEVNGNADPESYNNLLSSNYFSTTNIGSGTNFKFYFVQDSYGDQNTWKIIDNTTGNTMYSGGPYSNLLPEGSTLEHSVDITIDHLGCHSIIVNDIYNNGINGGYGNGSYRLEDENGNIVVNSDGVFLNNNISKFYIESFVLDVEEFSNLFAIIPNPAKNIISLKSQSNIESTIRIIDVLGHVIYENHIMNLSICPTINISSFRSGVYFVQINTNEQSITKRLVVE